jgi:hypothetical protein
MTGMVETVFGPPESAMDIDDERVGRGLGYGQPKVDELIWVWPLGEPEVGRRRLPGEDVFRHENVTTGGTESHRGLPHRPPWGNLLVPQRFDGVEIRGTQRGHHAADYPHHRQNTGRNQKDHRRDD